MTRLSMVDGEAGRLVIAGFPVEELAGRATFEETLYLLWNDALPDAGQLARLKGDLVARRALPEATTDLLRAAAGRVPAMDALRMAAGTLGSPDGGDRDDALRVVAAFPTIVAAHVRLTAGQEPIAPRADLSLAANFLYMVSGEEPDPAARALETYLVTVTDHGMNASTFTARVIASTASDMVSAVIGAIGALKGPLHGGAPGPALDMIERSARPRAPSAWTAREARTASASWASGTASTRCAIRAPRCSTRRRVAWPKPTRSSTSSPRGRADAIRCSRRPSPGAT